MICSAIIPSPLLQAQFVPCITHAPDRILDAPGVVDDFYLNALDWSVRGVLAVGLHGTVYLWSAKEGVRELTTFPGTTANQMKLIRNT